jgi:hypothetical protein
MSEEVWDLVGDEDDDRNYVNAFDENAVRPIVHRVLSELVNSSTGTLSLKTLRERLVMDEVLTPQQASTQSRWIERESQSFLASYNLDSGSSSDTGSHEVKRMADLSDVEEGMDVFSNVSQIFALESESSDAARNKTVPLNLSQQGMDDDDHNGEENNGDDEDFEPSLKPQKKRSKKAEARRRKKDYLKWHAGTLNPRWPQSVAKAVCGKCKARKPHPRCKGFMCTICCQESLDPCPSHSVRDDKVIQCPCMQAASKMCTFGLCYHCCMERKAGPCDAHLLLGESKNLRQVSLGHLHTQFVAELENSTQMLCESMFLDWSRGSLDFVATSVRLRSELGLVKRERCSFPMCIFEICAFMTGVALQFHALLSRSVEMLYESCCSWLSHGSRFGRLSDETRAVATHLMSERLLPLIRSRSIYVADLHDMRESTSVFDQGWILFLIGFALEAGCANFAPHETASSVYLDLLGKTDPEFLSRPLRVAALAGLARVSAQFEEDFKVLKFNLKDEDLALWLIACENGLEARKSEMLQLCGWIVARCPSYAPAVSKLISAKDPASIEVVMRALLVVRITTSSWWCVLEELLQENQHSGLGALEIFFYEELFVYFEGEMSASQAHVGSLLVAQRK